MDRMDLKPDKKNFYTGDMDAYHEGPCCSGCQGEQQYGYTGGGMYCCCYEGLTPLEQWGNPVRYPLVNGWFPPEFSYFSDKTKERYYNRFKEQLVNSVMDTYTRPDSVRRLVTNTKTGEAYVWYVS